MILQEALKKTGKAQFTNNMSMYFDGDTMKWNYINVRGDVRKEIYYLTKEELLSIYWIPYHPPKEKKMIEGWIAICKSFGESYYYSGIYKTKEDVLTQQRGHILGDPIFIRHEYEEE